MIILIMVVHDLVGQPNFSWVHNIGGLEDDYARCTAYDKAGNIYTTGYFTGTADFDPSDGTYYLTSNGGRDIFIQKVTPEQSLVWARAIGGLGEDSGEGIAFDRFGNMYVTGAFSDSVMFDPAGSNLGQVNAVASTDNFVLKLDTSGSFKWVKVFGGIWTDDPEAIEVDSAGNSYSIGRFGDLVDFDPSSNTYYLTSAGGWDAYLLKLDSNGNFGWVKQLGGSNHEYSRTLKLDDEGSIYTCGVFRSTTLDFDPGSGVHNLNLIGGRDAFLQKLDANGSFEWAINFGGTGIDWANGLVLDTISDHIYVCGYYGGTADFDPGSGQAQHTSIGERDVFVTKYTRDGEYVWARVFGSSGLERAWQVTIDSFASVITVGSFQDTVDFDPGSGVHTVASNGPNDIFVHKLDSNGNFEWVQTFGSYGFDEAIDAQVNASGEVIIAGCFSDTVDFDSDTTTALLSSIGGTDGFVLKLARIQVSDTIDTVPQDTAQVISELSELRSLEVYPNPSIDGTVTLRLHLEESSEVAVYDPHGALLDTYLIRPSQAIRIRLPNISGVYVFKYFGGEKLEEFRVLNIR